MSATTMDALARNPDKRCTDAGKLRQLLLGHVGADKPARAELSRLMTATFATRKADKETVVSRVVTPSASKDFSTLDFTDDATGLEPLAHGADLDAKMPSGISTSTGGAVTSGPKVVVHRPQSDPSLRTSHPARERKGTAPLAPMMAQGTAPPVATAPFPLSPSALPPPMVPNGAPANGSAAATEPHSTPSASLKPPRVPFYEDDEAARLARQEPTSLISRADSKADRSISVAVPPPKAKRKAPVTVLLGALVGFVLTIAFIVIRSKGQDVSAKPIGSASATASANVVATASATSSATSSAIAAAVSSPPPASAAPSPAESVSAAVPDTAPATSPATSSEKVTLSIDTNPAHATITLNGKKVGSSPYELKIPKSNDEVIVEIQHPGYVTLKERVVPDMSQRLKLSLVPTKTGKPAAASKDPYRKFE
jgi:hypothetical protein